MEPIYLLLINIFAMFLLINENILLERINKFKLGIALFNLLVCFVLVFTYSSMTNPSYLVMYNVFVILNICLFAYSLYQTLKSSALKKDYNQLLIRNIKSLENVVYYILDENEKFVDISDALLKDFSLKKDDVIGKRYMSIINKSIDVYEMNGKEINNNYLEQYYIRFLTTKNQDEKQIEFRYRKLNNHKEAFQVIEKPLFTNGKYRGRMAFGEKVTSGKATKIKADHHDLVKEYEDLQNRFVTTLDVLKEGVFYLTENSGEIWGTDGYKDIIGIESNVSNINEFIMNIHENDVDEYRNQIKMKDLKGYYRVTYRYIGKQSKWLLEEGRVIDTSQGKMTVGVVRELDSRKIDKKVSFADELDLKTDINRLAKNKKEFGLLRINIDQIKEMKAEYGRDATNFVVEEFVNKLKRNYQRNFSKVYELNHSEYAVVISDMRDFDVVTKSLLSGSDLLNLTVRMGQIDLHLAPSIGIISYPKDLSKIDDLLKAGERAVNMAKKEHYRHNFCFYKDIRDVI